MEVNNGGKEIAKNYVDEEIGKRLNTTWKGRIALYGHFIGMITQGLTKRIFDHFDENPKTEIRWLIDVRRIQS